MQGTTRSVEAVEGVALAKAMASGGIVSPSASVGGKSSVVVSTGGGGRSNKRKGLPGGHSSISSTLGQKKKLCSKANEMARVAEAAAVTSSSGGGGLLATKKIERTDETIVGDASLEDAARVLTEFSFLAHKPVGSSPPPPKPSTSHQSTIPALPQWKTTKLRSGRTKRLESSSNEDSHLVIGSDSSNLSPPPPLEKQQQPPQQQVSECSCSPGGDSQSVITLVKVEDDPLCSIIGVEGEEQVEQKKVELGVEEQEEKNTHRFPSNPDRLPKLASVSSIESIQPDSRAESPISPLPAVLRTAEFASIVPKFEGSSPTGVSAFQRVGPVRPVKKPSSSRKLKVEDKTFEDLNPEQAAVKHVSRKKPRPTGFVPQQQQQQLQEQEQQSQQQPPQLASVKIEEGDVCALALGPPRLSAAEEAQVKRIGEVSSIAPPAAVAVDEKTIKLDLSVVETKPFGKLGQRGGGKAKSALSESEKEARKQRRVQANRESARLTIRKKQVLCEDLTRNADLLTAENAMFREEVARLREKNKSIREMNATLSEQVVKANGKHEPESSPPPSSSMEKPPDGMVQYQFPPLPFGGMPMAPQQYMWAIAMAQAAQNVGVQPSEIKLGSAECTAVFAAAAAAAAACGNNPQAGFWSLASCSQGQAQMFPPFYQGHMPGASIASTLPSSSRTPAAVSAITRSVSLPVAATDGSSSLAAVERSFPSGKPVVSYRSGDCVDSVHLSHDLKKSATKQDSAHLGSEFSGRTHYFQMSSGSHAGLGSIATRKVGEGSCLPMPNSSGQLLGRSRSLSTPHKLHSRYSMFGSGGMPMTLEQQPSARASEAQRKGAAATEARRKRIELKRTKSLLNRQQIVARVADPSAQ